MYLLDVTNDRGASYNAVAICSSEEKAGEVIQRIFAKYNNEFAKFNQLANYDPNKWQYIQDGYICYPIGPGAEYRCRKFEVDDTSFLLKPRLSDDAFKQSLKDAEAKIIEADLDSENDTNVLNGKIVN